MPTLDLGVLSSLFLLYISTLHYFTFYGLSIILISTTYFLSDFIWYSTHMILFWMSLSPWFTSQPNILLGGRPYLRHPHLTRVWGSSIFPYIPPIISTFYISIIMVVGYFIDIDFALLLFSLYREFLLSCPIPLSYCMPLFLLPFPHTSLFYFLFAYYYFPLTSYLLFITDHLMIPVSHNMQIFFDSEWTVTRGGLEISRARVLAHDCDL